MDENFITGLKERIIGYSNDEVIEILKKRNLYDDAAARLAIQEAIKRGLINSEDDLLAEEYRVEPHRFRFFPIISNNEIKEKLIKSLSRGILLAGIIPAIYGFIKYHGKWNYSDFILPIGFSIIWIVSSLFFMKTKKPGLVHVLLLMAVLSAFYVAWIFSQMATFKFMDMFVAVIIYGIIFYNLLFAKYLISEKSS